LTTNRTFPSPGKDSSRIVTDAPALALEAGQDPHSLALLDSFELKLGQLIAAEGATDRKRQHEAVRLYGRVAIAVSPQHQRMNLDAV